MYKNNSTFQKRNCIKLTGTEEVGVYIITSSSCRWFLLLTSIFRSFDSITKFSLKKKDSITKIIMIKNQSNGILCDAWQWQPLLLAVQLIQWDPPPCKVGGTACHMSQESFLYTQKLKECFISVRLHVPVVLKYRTSLGEFKKNIPCLE